MAVAAFEVLDADPGPYAVDTAVSLVDNRVGNKGADGTVNVEWAELDSNGNVDFTICSLSISIPSGSSALAAGGDRPDGSVQCNIVEQQSGTGSLSGRTTLSHDVAEYWGVRCWGDEETAPAYPTPGDVTTDADGDPIAQSFLTWTIADGVIAADSMTVGNNDFKSNILLELTDVLSVPPTSAELHWAVENRIIDDGAFFDPRVELRLDGAAATSEDVTLDLGTRETRTTAISTTAGTHSVEAAIVGDWNADCWCTGDRTFDCGISSPSGDCMATPGSIDVGEILIVDGTGDMSPNPVDEDQQVQFTMDVNNPHDVDALVDVHFLDGSGFEWVLNSDVSIATGNTATLGATVIPQDIGIAPGDYNMTGEVFDAQSALAIRNARVDRRSFSQRLIKGVLG